MNRTIVFPGEVPLDQMFLQPQVDTMTSLGFLAQMVLGTSPLVDGLALTASSPASMTVNVGPGSITSLTVVDTSAFGSLAANSANLLKMGINTGATALTLSAPTVAGQSQNYLIYAQFSETDGTPVALPYYNASNPALPFTGPAGSGDPQNTYRTETVAINMLAGAAASTGAQTTPATPTGAVALYVLTTTYAQTTITSGQCNAAQSASTAPFINPKLPNVAAAIAAAAAPWPAQVVLTTASTSPVAVPTGYTRAFVRMVGGGGGGGGGTSTQASGGGGAGGYAEKLIVGLTPGATIPFSIGGAGTGGATGANGGTGGNTSFGSGPYFSATGGVGGNGGAAPGGGNGGTGIGGDENEPGGYGSDGSPGYSTYAGQGGSSYFGGGGRGCQNGGVPNAGQAAGSGGGGTYSATAGTGPGGTGAPGKIIIEWRP